MRFAGYWRCHKAHRDTHPPTKVSPESDSESIALGIRGRKRRGYLQLLLVHGLSRGWPNPDMIVGGKPLYLTKANPPSLYSSCEWQPLNRY